MTGGHAILRAKFAVPSLPDGQVSREALFGCIEPRRPVTLFCAPAGFGKTSPAVAWLSRQDVPFAWLSLDRRDNDAACSSIAADTGWSPSSTSRCLSAARP